ncbi:MAG TPA: hypothetical protein VN833_32755, partial [Candidatus Acidoferrales bacterium]|nr:hypothetical protein [Candidatus Acidoferrales bacterium]
MTERGADSKLFEEVIRGLLEQGLKVRFQARGASMSPAIRDGEIVQVTPVIVSNVRKGDIVLTRSNYGFRLHRIVVADHARDEFATRGDCGQENDPTLKGAQILGLAQAKEVHVGRRVVPAKFRGVSGFALRSVARAQHIFLKVLTVPMSRRSSSRTALGILGLLLVLLAASQSRAQVAVDATTSLAGLAPSGTNTGTFNHTTSAGANRLLIVSVAMDIVNSPGSTVTGVTYNGTALTRWGSHNDAGATRRVEMWYLLNPASGNNLPVAVTIDVTTAGATVGTSAAATTFTGVDQTVPLAAFDSVDGANGTNSQLDIPSVINGMVLDVLATGGDQTVTVSGPQVSQWNLTSPGTLAQGSLTSTGSSRTGAPSVPISETFSGTSNWALGAVSINPSSADLGVSTSVSAVTLGQHSTYNITVTNAGPSAALAAKLTDTFAATGLTLVSVTPSAGTTCTTAATITCTLPASFASGAVATIAVVVSTTAAGFYQNTAVVSDSGTPPDPNTGNNTYVALAPVVSVVCSGASLGPALTPLSGVLNTYFP